jgi:hypothetical protein
MTENGVLPETSSKQKRISEQSFKKNYFLESNSRRGMLIADSQMKRQAKASKRNSKL